MHRSMLGWKCIIHKYNNIIPVRTARLDLKDNSQLRMVWRAWGPTTSVSTTSQPPRFSERAPNPNQVVLLVGFSKNTWMFGAWVGRTQKFGLWMSFSGFLAPVRHIDIKNIGNGPMVAKLQLFQNATTTRNFTPLHYILYSIHNISYQRVCSAPGEPWRVPKGLLDQPAGGRSLKEICRVMDHAKIISLRGR